MDELERLKHELRDAEIALESSRGNIIATLKSSSEVLKPEAFTCDAIARAENEVNNTEEELQELNCDDYEVFVPALNKKNTNCESPCPGCAVMLPAYIHGEKSQLSYVSAYYQHCIKECEEYKKLGIIKKCHECKLLFLNKKSHMMHRVLRHNERRQPKWMTSTIFRAATHLKLLTKFVSCRGCNVKFQSSNRRCPELAYYIHCIEECDAYKKLKLIRECTDCKCKFLNPSALTKHRQKPCK